MALSIISLWVVVKLHKFAIIPFKKRYSNATPIRWNLFYLFFGCRFNIFSVYKHKNWARMASANIIFYLFFFWCVCDNDGARTPNTVQKTHREKEKEQDKNWNEEEEEEEELEIWFKTTKRMYGNKCIVYNIQYICMYFILVIEAAIGIVVAIADAAAAAATAVAVVVVVVLILFNLLYLY